MIYGWFAVTAVLHPGRTGGVLVPVGEVWAGDTVVMKGQANYVHHCLLGTLQRMKHMDEWNGCLLLTV